MNPWLIGALTVLIYMHLGFLASLLFKRNDLADMMWGPGFVLAAFSMHADWTPRSIAVFAAVFLWAARLSGYIVLRNLAQHEDWRYKEWRESWGKWFYLRSYLQVWILQGLFMYAIFYPVGVQMVHADQDLDATLYVGLALWVIGFVFETVGDEQLRRFKKSPAHKGKVMKFGLWRYTRHPNYFGEAVQWWGIAVAACTLPGGLCGFLSAGLITFMLLRVSGVTMTEKSMNKKAEFAEYKAKTSAFIPWPPRRA